MDPYFKIRDDHSDNKGLYQFSMAYNSKVGFWIDYQQNTYYCIGTLLMVYILIFSILQPFLHYNQRTPKHLQVLYECDKSAIKYSSKEIFFPD